MVVRNAIVPIVGLLREWFEKFAQPPCLGLCCLGAGQSWFQMLPCCERVVFLAYRFSQSKQFVFIRSQFRVLTLNVCDGGEEPI